MIYCPNPNCRKAIDDDSNFCHFCRTQIIPESSKPFIYDSLLELMKFEDTRRSDLDTKAATYVGLLSVSLTILTAFGGSIILQKGEIREISNFFLNTSLSSVQYFVFISYIIIVILFMLAVLLAVLAYSTGSKRTKSKDKGKNNTEEPRKDCYQNMHYDYVADFYDKPLYFSRDNLMPMLRTVIAINSKLNDEKSDKIKKVVWLTVSAILLLLLQTISLGLIGIKVL